jgi:ABC-type lipoprotein export system ATPase subunit
MAESTGAAVPAVQAMGLYHIYKERQVETVALRGAEIVLQPSSWTSVIGPSGSGKSTLVHILAGLVEPSAGSVRLEGEDFTRLPAAERARRRRRRVGVILQRDNLHPQLDAGGNIALPLRLDGRRASEVRARVDQLLEAVGLAGRARTATTRLSGGEAQRVAIAAALAPRPAVLLADELTGELDEATTESVLDLIETLRAEEGAAILTVTHNPLVAERAERRLTMRDGLLVDAG